MALAEELLQIAVFVIAIAATRDEQLISLGGGAVLDVPALGEDVLVFRRGCQLAAICAAVVLCKSR
jgi:3-dehydroquinate synthetase